MSAFLLVTGHFLLSLFGESFSSGYPLLIILMVGLLARASVGPVDVLMNMSGQQRICALVYGTTFSLNVMLNFLMIPVWGLYGAALATTGAMIFETVTLSLVVRQRLGLTLFIGFRKAGGVAP